MHGSDNFREVAFKLINVCDCLVNVFLNLLDNLFELFIVNGEIILENSNSLFAGFCKDYCNFINEVNL